MEIRSIFLPGGQVLDRQHTKSKEDRTLVKLIKKIIEVIKKQFGSSPPPAEDAAALLGRVCFPDDPAPSKI